MESKINQETTYEKKIDCKASVIRIPVSKDYKKYYTPSKPDWLNCEQTEEGILEISIKSNLSQKRNVFIICQCEGKANIYCDITQKGIKKSALFPLINGNYQDTFIDAYNTGKYPTTWPTAIIVRQGAIIDAVGFKYGDKIMQIGGMGGTLKEFPLRPGEYITGITGSRTTFNKNNLVFNSITFHTNKGNYCVRGDQGPHSNTIQYKVEAGNAVFCLHGKSNLYLSSIGFYETSIEG